MSKSKEIRLLKDRLDYYTMTNLSEEEFLDKMKSKGIKLAALSSYYHSSEKKKKYENIYVMNYSFVDCEKMEYVAKMITQVE